MLAIRCENFDQIVLPDFDEERTFAVNPERMIPFEVSTLAAKPRQWKGVTCQYHYLIAVT